MQRSIQRHLTVPSPIHKFPPQSREAGAPSNWQAPSQLFLYLSNFFHQLTTTLPLLALRDGVHGTSEEQAYRFINMFFCCN
jgi:hypothetical protein